MEDVLVKSFSYLIFYTPPHKKWRGICVAGYNVIPSKQFECPSVCPSALRFRAPTLVNRPIFFKLCIGIDIGEEWYGIANELILFRNNRVMTLDLCKNIVCVFEISSDEFRKNLVYALIYIRSRFRQLHFVFR